MIVARALRWRTLALLAALAALALPPASTQERDERGRWAAMSDADLDSESKNVRAQFDAVQKQHRAYNAGQNEGARDGYNPHEGELSKHAARVTAIEKEKEKREQKKLREGKADLKTPSGKKESEPKDEVPQFVEKEKPQTEVKEEKVEEKKKQIKETVKVSTKSKKYLKSKEQVDS